MESQKQLLLVMGSVWQAGVLQAGRLLETGCGVGCLKESFLHLLNQNMGLLVVAIGRSNEAPVELLCAGSARGCPRLRKWAVENDRRLAARAKGKLRTAAPLWSFVFTRVTKSGCCFLSSSGYGW